MTIRLRPHHLLCLLTYVGKGYSPAFTANYDVIAERVARGEDILIVSGPDDICAPLLNDADPHCVCESVTERDRLAVRDVSALLAVPVGDGQKMVLDAAFLWRIREAFSAGKVRNACVGCQWYDLCSSIATDGYRGAVLKDY
ncbi:DUF1284 domain-containing protein [Pseudaminobacter arsenicus]|uniref:DUF1284 domain-containing protein n=1 Tax=Borborobacter arsenicus TaxID=1851146 RepID=A0A432V2K7_9HYPH|nr:DUF1284 domain-containing protein [Pseudaminobacter arsenicus]RUM96292.1 DUF1284 domain-containing protein [Pseudaminobacter arsenicus]